MPAPHILNLAAAYFSTAEQDPYAGAYLATSLREDHDVSAVVPEGYVLPADARNWLLKASKLEAAEIPALTRLLPAAPLLRQPLSPPQPPTSAVAAASMGEEAIARSFLKLNTLPANFLALLAGKVCLLQTGKSSFKSHDVITLLREEGCETTSVSGTLRSMSADALRVPAKLKRVGEGEFEFTEYGAVHVAAILRHHGTFLSLPALLN